MVRSSAQTTEARAQVCVAAGKSEITIDCQYSPTPADGAGSEPKIALVSALIRLHPRRDGRTHVELSFKNIGDDSFNDGPTVYIEFDDDAGRNYIRRTLPNVDLRQIPPGEMKKFSDAFLAPALRPNRYIVRLWIPSPDVSVRFDRSHDFLLGGAGVSEKPTGLNRIATITVQP